MLVRNPVFYYIPAQFIGRYHTHDAGDKRTSGTQRTPRDEHRLRRPFRHHHQFLLSRRRRHYAFHRNQLLQEMPDVDGGIGRRDAVGIRPSASDAALIWNDPGGGWIGVRKRSRWLFESQSIFKVSQLSCLLCVCSD